LTVQFLASCIGRFAGATDLKAKLLLRISFQHLEAEYPPMVSLFTQFVDVRPSRHRSIQQLQRAQKNQLLLKSKNGMPRRNSAKMPPTAKGMGVWIRKSD
jgi:hypothetical protein